MKSAVTLIGHQLAAIKHVLSSCVWQSKNLTSEVASAVNITYLRRNFKTSSGTMAVPSPEVLKIPMKVPPRLLLGPGPSNCPPRVLQAQSNPVLGHLHPEFIKIMDDTKAGIEYIFQTKSRTVCCISGTGHAGMEATLANLLEPGELVLIASNGIWGQRAADMSKRQGLSVAIIEKSAGDTFTLEDIESAIKLHRPKVFFIVQGESSTGVLQPLVGIGKICHSHDVLFAVDTVASLGGVPFKMDEWEVDCVYTGSQKVLGAPPSLAPIAISDKARNVIYSRKTPVQSFYTDLTHLANYWGCEESNRRYHHTGPISSIYALREALAIVSEEGLESVQVRHSHCADMLYTGLEKLGLELFVKDKNKRLPTVTTIKVPNGVDWTSVTKYLIARNVEISGGLGPTANKVWRIGLMGYNCTEHNVERVLNLLRDALANNSKL